MKLVTTIATALAMVLIAAVTLAADQSLLQLGQRLFNDPALGGSPNSQSCNSCHQGGAGFESDTDIPIMRMINRCLVDRMGGSNVDRSVDVRALRSYVLSFYPPMIDAGRRLFNDPYLGGPGNSLTCNSCHEGGAGLENAARGPLRRKVSQCLVDRMGGSDTPRFSMRALRDYILNDLAQ